MAAVKPIARAPQNTTRMVGLKTSAPPVFAPIIPSKARKANDPTETIGSSQVDGERRARMRGPAAPTENVAADASAACIGRAVLISETPSSSRACAPKTSLAVVWGFIGQAQARFSDFVSSPAATFRYVRDQSAVGLAKRQLIGPRVSVAPTSSYYLVSED